MSILPPPPVHPGQPVFSLKVNGQEISREANNRLVSLSLTDNSGDEADSLTITLSDHDGKLALPPHNAEITLAIGYAGGDLVDKGKYLVDETAHDGPPDQLTIVARSADFRPDFLPGKRSRSWHDTTLGRITKEIGTEHMVRVAISDTLNNIRIGTVHQTAESDTYLLMRLAKKYDAQVSVKNGWLIFGRIGENAAGETLPTVTIERKEIETHNYRNASRDAYTGVKARWNNVSGGALQYLLVGEAGNTTELPATYATETDARNAAETELAQLQRGRATLSLQLVKGRPEIVAGQPLKIKGIKEVIDSVEWVIKRVVHTIDEGSGFTTSIEAEVYQASAPVESEPEEEPEGE
jgi:phage protein D